MTPAAAIPTVTLNDDNTIPVLGLGVAELSPEETESAVAAALEAGYRLIDTAAAYGNEEAVGRAVAASGIPREDLFITTKLATEDQGFQSAQDAIKGSLERLGLDYVDLYLIHWPAEQNGKYIDAWGGIMRSRADGFAKSIGVSNFTPEHLSNIIDLSFFTPAVNQIELHPLLNQAELRAVHAEHAIRHRGLQPARRRQAAGEPGGHDGGGRTRQVTGAGADPLEPAAGQRGDPPLVEPGAHRRERRGLRLRVDPGADGQPQRSGRRHAVPAEPRDLHRHLAGSTSRRTARRRFAQLGRRGLVDRQPVAAQHSDELHRVLTPERVVGRHPRAPAR